MPLFKGSGESENSKFIRAALAKPAGRQPRQPSGPELAPPPAAGPPALQHGASHTQGDRNAAREGPPAWAVRCRAPAWGGAALGPSKPLPRLRAEAAVAKARSSGPSAGAGRQRPAARGWLTAASSWVSGLLACHSKLHGGLRVPSPGAAAPALELPEPGRAPCAAPRAAQQAGKRAGHGHASRG